MCRVVSNITGTAENKESTMQTIKGDISFNKMGDNKVTLRSDVNNGLRHRHTHIHDMHENGCPALNT